MPKLPDTTEGAEHPLPSVRALEEAALYDAPPGSSLQPAIAIEAAIYDEPPEQSTLMKALSRALHGFATADSSRLAEAILPLMLPHLLGASEGRWTCRFRLGNDEFYVNISRVTDLSGPIEHSLKNVLDRCKDIDRRIANDHEQRIAELQSLVHDLGGQSFGSLHANKLVASALESLAQKLAVRFACPRQIKEEDEHARERVRICGQPARLDCAARNRNPHGLFRFRHALESGQGDVHISSKVIPEQVTLIPAPLDRRRRHLPPSSTGPERG